MTYFSYVLELTYCSILSISLPSSDYYILYVVFATRPIILLNTKSKVDQGVFQEINTSFCKTEAKIYFSLNFNVNFKEE